MRSKPTEFYQKAARAFLRLHGYPHDPGKLEHLKFMAGWQQGYLAARRSYRRRSNGHG